MKKVISILCLLGIACSLLACTNNRQKAEAAEIVSQVEEFVSEVASEKFDTADNKDVEVLKKYQNINPLTTGLLSIEGLVDEPVLTVPDFNRQNEYINKDIYGSQSKSGSLFTAYDAVFGVSDVTCIFGHTMRNGQMFGSLKNFLDEKYTATHPMFAVVTKEGRKNVSIVAVGHVDSNYERSGWYYPQPNLSEEEFATFKTNVVNMAEVTNADIESFEYGTKFVILSCCSYAYEGERLIVVGAIV